MANKIRGWNEGTIHQRPNGSWRAQVTSQGQRIGKTCKTKTAAQMWLRQMQLKLDQGFDVEASKITVADYLPQWLDTNKPAIQSTTAYHYKIIIDKHIVPYIGTIPLGELRLARIESLYTELLESGLGIRTVRITHSVLHAALEKAVRQHLILRNPAHGAAQPRYRHAEMCVLDETQVTQFLITANESPYSALYHLAVQTGMRQGELFGLKWSDLQWNRGVLHVQRQVKRPPGKGWQFSEPKTKAGRRTIQLGERVLQALREHRERQSKAKRLMGIAWQENGLMFTNSVGNPGDGSNIRKDFYSVLEAAGLPKIRFHDLRHTAATLMLNHSVSPIVVSKMLGHSKPSVTMDIYGHLLYGMQAEAAKLMDELVSPIPVDSETFAVKTPVSRASD